MKFSAEGHINPTLFLDNVANHIAKITIFFIESSYFRAIDYAVEQITSNEIFELACMEHMHVWILKKKNVICVIK